MRGQRIYLEMHGKVIYYKDKYLINGRTGGICILLVCYYKGDYCEYL